MAAAGGAGGGSAFDVAGALAAEPANAKPSTALAYGTAGFRAKADLLPSTALRMGMLAALRSRKATAEAGELKAIGVMVTASHNPVADNGLKITDADGGMLAASWERHATALANADNGGVADALRALAAEEGIDEGTQCAVFLARDTRPSSELLAALVRDGAIAAGADVLDFGLLTTPQLHHTVRYHNTDRKEDANETGYFRMLRAGYIEVLNGAPIDAARGALFIDGAHGIGADKVPALADAMKGLVKLEARNAVGEGELNAGCGAEHVQKGRLPPHGFDATADVGKRLCSLDGDADRLVYHYFSAERGWRLLDGDRIAALAATFLRDQLGPSGLNWTIATEGVAVADPTSAVTLGVVQTAYANGASTRYIRDTLKLPVPLAKTGVKYVHHKATEFDIGVYFEANGHGTILFSDRVLARLRAMDPSSMAPHVAAARSRLIGASILINQAIGDALSDAMFCEAVLTLKGWSVENWDALYEDLPSRQTKLAVADRTKIVTNEDESRVVSLPALQAAIDAAVAEVESGRAFVRPSGTEDVVRVYAEAATEDAANALAHRVAMAAYEHAGGVGDPPAPIG